MQNLQIIFNPQLEALNANGKQLFYERLRKSKKYKHVFTKTGKINRAAKQRCADFHGDILHTENGNLIEFYLKDPSIQEFYFIFFKKLLRGKASMPENKKIMVSTNNLEFRLRYLANIYNAIFITKQQLLSISTEAKIKWIYIWMLASHFHKMYGLKANNFPKKIAENSIPPQFSQILELNMHHLRSCITEVDCAYIFKSQL